MLSRAPWLQRLRWQRLLGELAAPRRRLRLLSRQLEPHRHWLLPLAAGLALSGLGLGWIGRDLGGGGEIGQRPSLLEQLRQMGRPPATAPLGRAPAPPTQAPWRSPLRRQCQGVDRGLQQRLQAQLASLPSRRNAVRIDPSNYGERFREDAFGNPLDPTPRLVVLHETVYGLGSAINTFRTPHANDDDQVSYHILIGEDGRIVQAVDPGQRAFGAGYSAFNGAWVVSNAALAGSVNNFALHVSLETPLDGEHDGPSHSGYSQAQYDALAVVLADWMGRFPIPATAVTTHRHVDLGGARADPRSFDWRALQSRLAALGKLC
ncbi:N-acetylmuramoyl-L-alanine amidase [Vulcanococcus limneticus]|uniref:N-acetylmuramoyl-L-alanine amidase n=1 Tax=Vulcanococcus limneticus TaxID=2170428 RepID=UPI00398BC3D0